MANRIELDKEIFTEDIDKEVSSLLSVLTKAGYGCYVWEDEFTVVIDYDFRDEELANTYHYWLNGEEAETIDGIRAEKTNSIK